ncbi:hypothetical protein SCLCIDRAFT_1040410 [Scleroderma citrinum Foug A]|uniref:Uncharacterized protein n=1 Tax=Scleroderma citrinum Foug A TaxID=1036808 RepID=A0A0C3DT66_9AGAM|nr:hypothetical protein SCLCIDRAFT_1040410 [Scleroderma citrinum Foug A]
MHRPAYSPALIPSMLGVRRSSAHPFLHLHHFQVGHQHQHLISPHSNYQGIDESTHGESSSPALSSCHGRPSSSGLCFTPM